MSKEDRDEPLLSKGCVENNGRMPSMHFHSYEPNAVPLAIDLVNMIGGVFPIVPDKASRNYWKLGLLSIYPFCILVYYFAFTFFRFLQENTNFLQTCRALAFVFVGVLTPASLSYTRRAYNLALSHFNKKAMEKYGKKLIFMNIIRLFGLMPLVWRMN